MTNRFPIYGFFRSIKNFLLSLVLFLIASCAPAVAPSIPEPTATLAPTPTEVSSTNTVLYRGDAQRSGVFDFPAIRQGPAVQWQATLATTWLMPPVVAEGVLYAGSGNGVIYAVDTQTGEKL